MKRTLYTHWRGYTVYNPQGIPLLACCTVSKDIAKRWCPKGLNYKVAPVVMCHPRYFRATKPKGNK